MSVTATMAVFSDIIENDMRKYTDVKFKLDTVLLTWNILEQSNQTCQNHVCKTTADSILQSCPHQHHSKIWEWYENGKFRCNGLKSFKVPPVGLPLVIMFWQLNIFPWQVNHGRKAGFCIEVNCVFIILLQMGVYSAMVSVGLCSESSVLSQC